MKTLLALALLLVLAPLPALAAVWGDCTTANDPIANVVPPGSVCVDLVSGDLDSAILDVERCENFDVVYNSDQAGTDHAVTVQLMTCVTQNANANACEPFDGVTLDGNPPLEGIWGATAKWIWFDGSGTIDDDLPRVLVKCNDS